MATSHADVELNRRRGEKKPGGKMERGLQGLFSTGQVVIALACQQAEAMSHAVGR